jgi:lipopolysaccharide/colanic/teichoic acid biosynthesis glycosyltransferase
MFKYFIKPFGDLIISLLLLIILSPIITLTAILLLIANNGKIFFFQQRPGLNCKPFKIVKFKTMRDAFDNNGDPLPDDVRLTMVGRFVRSASLDELLQLLNVLKGDMSLVGPRPLLMHYLPRYNTEQTKRHNVKPGITGLASLVYRNEEEILALQENPEKYNDEVLFPDKVRLNLQYLKDYSFWMDLKILWHTLFGGVPN